MAGCRVKGKRCMQMTLRTRKALGNRMDCGKGSHGWVRREDVEEQQTESRVSGCGQIWTSGTQEKGYDHQPADWQTVCEI